jgi:hypothetical protein
MAQHDYNFANQALNLARADVNNAMSAIHSNNSGSTAPSTTTAFSFWADDSNNVMNIRNDSNNGWISMFKTDGVQQYASGNTSSLPAFSKADDVNTGLYFPAADTVAISCGGTEKLRVNSSGIIGDVTGDVTGDLDGIVGGTTPADITGTTITATTKFIGDIDGDVTGGVLTAAQTNITSIGTLSSLSVSGDLIVDTNTMKVDTTNNRVGIGTTTPTKKLDVNGTIKATGLDVAGAVLQVVSVTKTDTFSSSGNTWTTVTGLSVSITPKSTSSQILILFNMSLGVSRRHVATRLIRNSTPIALGTPTSYSGAVTTSGFGTAPTYQEKVLENAGMNYQDSPNTTSSVTYALQISNTADYSNTFYVNRTYDDNNSDLQRGISSITVQEIGG